MVKNSISSLKITNSLKKVNTKPAFFTKKQKSWP